MTTDVPAGLPGRSAAEPVGPGWYLASVAKGAHGEWGIEAPRQRLVLIEPHGHRHQVLDRAVRRGGFRLVDWSPDGATALLVSQSEENPARSAFGTILRYGDRQPTGH